MASASVAPVPPQTKHEPWTNECGALPLQVNSRVAFAARDLEYVEANVPVPLGLDRMPMPKQRLRCAVAPQMRLVQDAFDGCNRLTVLFRENDLERLRRAEKEEIEAAVRELRARDDTLPARATSVTVLVNPARTSNAPALLDAAAHLARAPTTAHPPRRGVHDTRVAFLVGNQARQYAAWHAPLASKTKSAMATKGGTELCLTWAEPRPVADDATGDTTEVWQVRSEFAEIPWCADADAYLSAVRSVMQRLWCNNGFLPNATRLLGSYAECGSAVGAYVDGMVGCADDFWGRLRVTGASRLSPYAQNSDDYCGCLEFSRQFVKLVPKTPQGVPDLPPDHPSVYHGLLLHQRGMEVESKEFCESIKNEEAAKAAAEKRPFGVFGLRRPASSAEEAVCPHLLLMTADHTTLGRHVTTYGLVCAPGKRLCATNGNVVPRLMCRIVPLDDEIIQQAFVLPCIQSMCNPVHDVLRAPMWEAMEAWVDEYAELFGSAQPLESPVGKRRARALALATQQQRLRETPTPEPSDEQRHTGLMLGLPLGCAAFRVGDVYNAVRDEKCVDAVARFLLAATSTIGSEASIEDAFVKAADAMATEEQTATAHAEEVGALKRKLTETELRVEVLERRDQNGKLARTQAATSPQHPPPEAVVKPPPPRKGAPMPTPSIEDTMDAIEARPLAASNVAPAMQLPYRHLKMLLAGAGQVVGNEGFRIREQWKKFEIKSLCALLQTLYRGIDAIHAGFFETTTLEWGRGRLKHHGGEVDDLTLLCEVLGHGVESVDGEAFVLLWVEGEADDDDVSTVYRVETTGVAKAVPPLKLLDLASFPIVMWRSESRLVGPVDVV